MIQLENAKFTVGISEKGAELQHLVNKAANFDYIWDNKGREFWGRHAPILFPFIGKSNNDSYLVNGQTYPMHQHGFGRDQTFKVASQDATNVTMFIDATDETKKIYPFDFHFEVHYHLTGKGLETTFNVTNTGNDKMAFSLGFHPGFNVPFDHQGNYEDYRIKVSPFNAPIQQFKIDPVPFRNGEVGPLAAAKQNVIPVSHDLFKDGLIILANQDIQRIKLYVPGQPHSVELTLNDFPYVAMWSMEDKKAPFVCMEPFAGLPDKYGDPVDLFQKEGNMTLEPQASRSFTYHMNVK